LKRFAFLLSLHKGFFHLSISAPPSAHVTT
jgi:hypothetical protein